MTTIKMLRLLHLITYLFISSQLLFYVLILNDAMKAISIENFLEQRKIVDLLAGERLKILYYAGLLLSLIVLVVSCRKIPSPFFITSVIAFLCLLADLLIALKGNIPLNAQFNTYTAGIYGTKWEALRSQWLTYMHWRGTFILLGMTSLLTGLMYSSD